MVMFQEQQPFFSRNSAGKHRLGVAEIRALAVESEALLLRIKEFKPGRIAASEVR